MRITQEALTNVRKHLEATSVCVTLRSTPNGAEVSIKDNGRGFDPGAAVELDGTGHHGLLGMQERTEGLGGTFTIEAAPGEGTEVKVFLPKGRGRGVIWKG